MRLRSSIRSRSIALSLVESSLRFLELYRSTKTSRDTIESDGFSVHEYEVLHDSSQTIITLPHPSISFPSIYYRPTAKILLHLAIQNMTDTSSDQEERAQLLRALHVPGAPLILCNVYDGATAKIIGENPNCKAIATASYGVAAAQGTEDNDMTLEQNLNGLRAILPVAQKYGKPVTVDLQDGYGHRLEQAIESIIELGAVGCNLEDFDRGSERLFSLEEATARARLVLNTAAKKGVKSFALNARTDILKWGGSIEDAIQRAEAYLEAGATTAFVLGGSKRGGLSRAEIVQLVQALDGKINVLMGLGPGYLTVSELKEIGVARVSVGPGLYRKAMKAYSDAANALVAA
jgi:2-methylisocitrate lyase-like PEP mutase family enzyme